MSCVYPPGITVKRGRRTRSGTRDSSAPVCDEPLPPLSPRLDIQGLWAVAVCVVILGHAQVPGFRGGFVGVDVFFVLSGFLISTLLLNDATTTGAVHIGTF